MADGVSEQQLLEIKLMLARYFVQQSTETMDKVLETQKLPEFNPNRFHDATTRLLELAKESNASSIINPF